MALRIRRGTDADRQTITFAEGELVYTTDTKKLYIGDGITAGGILAGGEANSGITSIIEDITPQLGGNLDLNNLEINGIGNINISGTVTADVINSSLFVGDGSGLTNLPIINNGDTIVDGSNYRINIVGEDSTIIIDSFSNTVTGNFVGDGSQITNLPSISLFDLSNVFAFTPPDIGDMLIFDGFNFVPQKITLIEGNDSSIMLDTFSNTFTGNFVGDGSGLTNLPSIVEGEDYRINIFGDDSTLLVDTNTSSLNGIFKGDIIVASTIQYSQLDSGTSTSIRLSQYGGTESSKLEPFNFARQGIKFASWDTGIADFVDESLIFSYHQTGGGSLLALSPTDSSGNFFNTAIEIDGVANKTTISGAVVVNNSMKLAVYATTTERDAAITSPEAGMLCFVSDGDGIGNPEFQGYNGITWNKLN